MINKQSLDRPICSARLVAPNLFATEERRLLTQIKVKLLSFQHLLPEQFTKANEGLRPLSTLLRATPSKSN